jgi:hypothetical protein
MLVRLGPAPNSGPGERSEASRDYVWSRIAACGGLTSLPGSLCWKVVGLEISLHAWAIERSLHNQRVNQHGACGVLISVVTLLAVDTVNRHWRPPRVPMPDGIVAAADMPT